MPVVSARFFVRCVAAARGAFRLEVRLTWCSRACSKLVRRARSTCTTRREIVGTRHSAGTTRASRDRAPRAARTGRRSDAGSPHTAPSRPPASPPTCRRRRRTPSAVRRRRRRSRPLRRQNNQTAVRFRLRPRCYRPDSLSAHATAVPGVTHSTTQSVDRQTLY